MNRKKKKWLIRALVILLLVIVAGVGLGGNYLVDYAIVRKAEANDVAPASVVSEEDQAVIAANQEAIEAQKEAWLASAKREDAQIESEDGLLLKGDVFWTDPASHRWVIAVHGYGGERSGMYNIASFYSQEGYMLRWIDYVLELDPSAQIVLHGVSMGGATVMMTAGEELPEQVQAIVEDCGYTSVWDIFSDELEYLFHLPEFPLLYAADGIAWIRAGYEFKEASALEQVKKSSVPILFIHGSEDNFVHTEMVYELYDACASEKELLVVEGAGHGEAYSMDPELYFDTVFGFLKSV